MAFPAIGLITFTLALTGMIGLLRIGVYVSALYLVPAVVILISKRKLVGKYILTPGFAAFCIYIIFFLVFSKGRFFVSDASRAQYAPSLLNMIRYNSLQDHALYYNLNDPFPLGNLWSYFCTGLIGGYADWVCIFAYDVFIVSGFLPLFLQIKSVKEESWQWLVMLFAIPLLPLLKMGNAYSDYDMAIQQTAAMVYTFYIVYRVIHGKERKGDVLFAAYGFCVSCTLTKYGMFVTLPLMVACCTVAYGDAVRRKKLFLMLGAGTVLSVVFQLYDVICKAIGWKQFLLVPGCVLSALVMGAVLSAVVRLYDMGKIRGAMILFCGLTMIVLAFTVIILRKSPYMEYVTEEVVEFTDKLFTGAAEEDHTIGRNVVRIYDTTFLFILLVVSGISYKKGKRKNAAEAASLDAFRLSYIYGVFLYILLLCVLYINVLRRPKAYPVPEIAPYIAPVIILSTVGVFLRSVRTWKKDLVYIVGMVFLVGCVYTDPVGEIFQKPEREYSYPVIQECIENGKIHFTEEDRVFYMDPQWYQDLPVDFKWEVYPAGADMISGMHFNADPYHWSGGEIQFTMTVEELETLLRDGKYTYVYLDNIVDFHVNTYHTLFAEVGQGMVEDAIYRVDYDKDGNMQLIFLARD